MIDRYRVDEIKQIWDDENRYRTYLDVEIAVMEAQERLGIIPKGMSEKVRKSARIDIGRIKEIEEVTRHDIIAFVTSIEKQTGDAGRFLHYGLTSSDVIDTAIAILMKRTIETLIGMLDGLIEVSWKRAVEEKYTPIVGRTHGIHAEPTTLGLKILSWVSELDRAKKRLDQTLGFVTYGKISGPVGTYSHLPSKVEKIALEKLGLKPEPVSTQIVPRDRYIEFIYSLVMVGEAIERMAMEIRHLQRTEIRELEEPFTKGQRGSSAMPHKRNPIVCERLTGMARLLRGYLVTVLENNAPWNERDISHSSVERIVLPDASELLAYMIKKATFVIENLTVYRENMKRNLSMTKGLIFSGSVLLFLVKKGLTRDEAYKIVQRNGMKAWEGENSFLDYLLQDEDIMRLCKEEELRSLFDMDKIHSNVDEIFGRVEKELRKHNL